ncbi:iron-siderophore ABC transporter substrate-binding protein [Frankia nepalensis]|uniref:Iron-siderophore ABC transporter substrate-binding protein n=1 Tax=Frankia nepalensis TaxID=1836974 RepID=A0A937UQA7_9ACTN|nr:iron-siderophore ABC transporter substrate-binding protein [Frankia nepalensis]MBL7630017.1 iron-siderophore ABC transporter substrate-binding protein [Frankia nepalensis]
MALVGALLLAACGGGGGGGATAGGGTGVAGATATAEPGAFPVTIEHKYGGTELDEAPQRVVTLGLSDHEPVLAFGVRPVGAIDWYGERPYGIWPWTDKLWGDARPEIVGQREDFNVEKIARLRPDLIIALYTGMSEQQYKTLSRIAPVVAQPKDYDDYGAPWTVMTTMVGEALGQPAKAKELIAGVEKHLADARAAHPEFAGQTVAVADSTAPGTYSVFSPTDPKSIILAGLGFQVPDEIGALADGKFSVPISAERLDLVDADRLVWLVGDDTVEGRIKADPVYQRLAVAREDRAVFLPYGRPVPIGGALSFGTVLSIPWAVDQIVPRLVA